MAGASKKGKKGFAGLSSLVSELDLADEFHEQVSNKADPPQSQHVSQSQQAEPLSGPHQQSADSTGPTATTFPGKHSSNATKIWVFVVCIGIGLAILATQRGGDNNKKYSQPPAPAPQRYSAPQSNSASLAQGAAPAVSQNAQPHYTMPPIGTNHLLAIAEIQWCIRNSIRIETIRSRINTNTEIDGFNRIVIDHNSRCGNYRYPQGAQAQAERNVEPYISQIVAESIREADQLGRSQSPPLWYLSDLTQESHGNYIVYKDKHGNRISGLVAEYGLDGRLVSEGPVVNGVREGVKKEYWPGGNLVKVEMTFSSGFRHGERREYSPSGLLIKKSWWENHKLVSSVTPPQAQWSLSDLIQESHGSHILFKDKSGNRISGLVIEYDLYGNIVSEGHVLDGVREGVKKEYWPGGKVIKIETTFSKGVRNGERREYSQTGRLIKKSWWKNHKKVRGK